MTWTYEICSTMTGARLGSVDPVEGSFSRTLNGDSSGSHTFDSFQARRDGIPIKAHTALLNRVLVVCWNDVPHYAGIFISRTPDFATERFATQHVDVRGLLKRRTTFSASGYSPTGALTMTGRSYRAIASRIVGSALVGPTSNYTLPIARPSESEEGTRERTLYDYNTPIVNDELDQIINVTNGPDVDFKPRWSAANTLEWEMRVGSEETPDLGGPGYDFNMTAANPPLRNLGLTETADMLASTVYAVGNGSEQKLRIRSASASSNLPATERLMQYSQVDNLSQLQAHATADQKTYGTPTRQWTLTLPAAGPPHINYWRLGSVFRVYFQGHWWMPDGFVNLRVIGYRADMSNDVVVDVQEVA